MNTSKPEATLQKQKAFRSSTGATSGASVENQSHFFGIKHFIYIYNNINIIYYNQASESRHSLQWTANCAVLRNREIVHHESMKTTGICIQQLPLTEKKN